MVMRKVTIVPRGALADAADPEPAQPPSPSAKAGRGPGLTQAGVLSIEALTAPFDEPEAPARAAAEPDPMDELLAPAQASAPVPSMAELLRPAPKQGAQAKDAVKAKRAPRAADLPPTPELADLDAAFDTEGVAFDRSRRKAFQALPPAIPGVRREPGHIRKKRLMQLAPEDRPAWVTKQRPRKPAGTQPLAPTGVGPSRLVYTRQTYDRILTLYRDIGVNHSAVAREAGWHPRTIRRAYDEGWPQYKWARPIRLVLEQDIAEAKSTARDRAEELRREVNAKASVAKTKLEEAILIEEQVLVAARKNVAAAYGLSAQLVPAVAAAVSYVRETMCRQVVDVGGEKWVPKTGAELKAAGIDPMAALRLVDRHALVLQRVSNTAKTIIDLSRVGRGDPTEITEERKALIIDMSAEDALREMENQDEALRLIRLEAMAQRKRRLEDRGGTIDTEGEDITERESAEDAELDEDEEPTP